MVRIDLGYFRYLHRIVAVMARWMVRVRHADIGISTIALFARKLEGDDARDVRLKRQNLKVEHELGMVGEGRRNAYGPVEVGCLIVRDPLLGPLDLTLDLTHAVEILIQT